MAKYSIEDSTLSAIAEAIREKAGTSETMTPADMAEAIAAIKAGGGRPFATGTLTRQNQKAATISGLSFAPKLVLVTNATYIGGGADTFYDSENGVYYNVLPYYETVTKSSAQVMTLNSDGFTLKSQSLQYYGITLHWYAIGAEE